MQNRITEKDGFSPVEVLIAMAILAIGVVAVMRLFPQSMRASQVAHERTIAAELADSNMGRIRMTGASNLMGIVKAAGLYNIDPMAAANDLYTSFEGYVPTKPDPDDPDSDSSPSDDLVDGYTTVLSRVGGPLNEMLVRVTFSVDMPDGRRENFVTYVTDY